MTVQSILLRESNSSPKKKEKKKQTKGAQTPGPMEQVRKTKQNKTRKKTKDCLSQLRTFYWLRKETNHITGNFLVQVIGFSPSPSSPSPPTTGGQWPKRLEGEEPKSKTTPRQREEEVGTGPPGICWFVDCTVYLSVCVCVRVCFPSPLLYPTHTHTHTHTYIYISYILDYIR